MIMLLMVLLITIMVMIMLMTIVLASGHPSPMFQTSRPNPAPFCESEDVFVILAGCNLKGG